MSGLLTAPARLLAGALLAGVLLAGCTALPATPVARATTPAPVDDQVLLRWWEWTDSAVADDGYPELPHRDRCARDPKSARWFLDTPSGPGRNGPWTCTLPAGSTVMVVPATLVSSDQNLCDQSLTGLVPVTSTAVLDNRPVTVHRDEARTPAQPGVAAMCLQARWGTTGPLSAGPHTITLTHTLAGTRAEVTVDITAR